MILLGLFLAGATIAVVNALTGPTNGGALIGVLMMLPAISRGLTHDAYLYITIPTFRRKAQR